MSRKGIVILSSVVVVCAAGLLVSNFVDWSVEGDATYGDIGKSSRVSRKADLERIDDLEAIIRRDDRYKDVLVMAYTVMQTRVRQLDALVSMSGEVAGGIPELAEVLESMDGIRPEIGEVSASLSMAGADLDASLSGESRPALTRKAIDATLAYTTLQKQNKLADRFISATDKYLKKTEGDERLLFVRDQWVDYQRMTAALSGDARSALQLEKKGVLLSPGQRPAALNSFDAREQVALLSGASVSGALHVENQLVDALPPEMIGRIPLVIAGTANVAMQHADAVSRNDIQGSEVGSIINHTALGLRLPR